MASSMQTAIGLMSGTSMDGIDVALVRTDGDRQMEFGPTLAIEFEPAIRRRIEQGLQDALTIRDRMERPGALRQLEQDLTDRHAQAVARFLARFGLSATEIDLLGFHGQTVLHRPEIGMTVQLGDGDSLAKATGINVVSDFRAADMEAAGQGAPLVPVFHQALLQQTDVEVPVCFVNIGGIS